jgi:hypothetical protein
MGGPKDSAKMLEPVEPIELKVEQEEQQQPVNNVTFEGNKTEFVYINQ